MSEQLLPTAGPACLRRSPRRDSRHRCGDGPEGLNGEGGDVHAGQYRPRISSTSGSRHGRFSITVVGPARLRFRHGRGHRAPDLIDGRLRLA
jgi:hypothetical protein